MTDRPALSPSALNRFLACEHRTYLDILERRGEMRGLRLPPDMSLLFERGDRHEDAVVAGLVAEGLDVVALEDEDATAEERAQRTIAAMREGRGILHQGCFARDGWLGYPDFLIRIDEPSDLGAWSYEVYDAKLGQPPAAAPHLPAALLHRRAGAPPGSASRANASHARRRDERRRSRPTTSPPTRPGSVRSSRSASPSSPAWSPIPPIRTRSASASSVTGGRSATTAAATTTTSRSSPTCTVGRASSSRPPAIHTVGDLAGLDEDATVPRLTRATLGTLRAQASICRSAAAPLERPLYELLEPEAERGLARLPEPSAGDVFFDFEGDPYWGEDGLEYLFGTALRGGRRVALLAAVGDVARRGEARARAVAGLDHRSARTSTPTCTCSTSTPTSRRRSRSSSRATRSASTSSTSCCAARCSSTSTASAGRRSAPASRATG